MTGAPRGVEDRDRDDRSRALTFLRDVVLRAAEHSEPFAWGTAAFTPRLPRSWDLNQLLVERAPPELDAATLQRTADRLQGAAGLTHRKAAVLVPDAGERLAPDLQAAGWTVQRHVVMAHRTPPDRAAEPGVVQAVAGPLAQRAHERSLEPMGYDAETARQLVVARQRVGAVTGQRTFAALAGGEPVSVCDLLSIAGIGQIEDVATLPDHRGRGFARAVVLAALDASRAAGHELTLIVADEDDWPAGLYARLGFARIARIHQFIRPG